MKVPFLDLKAQLFTIRSEIEERFSSIIDDTAFVCGRSVADFEEKFAEMQNETEKGNKFAIGPHYCYKHQSSFGTHSHSLPSVCHT